MNAETRPTRRAFMTGVAKKAGADFTGCVGPGSPCAVNADCCSATCLTPSMMACGGAPNCNCQ
jgi:hypothetical protein